MESDSLSPTLRAGLRLILRPIVRLLLRSGFSYQEFADVAKLTYAEVATREFGIRGRPTNVSRVAILTGFTRREARRLRDLLDQETPGAGPSQTAASRVLSAWHQQPEFVSPDGSPKLLARDGEAPSFADLARRFGADVPPTALLKELRTAGAVELTTDDRVRVLQRSFVPRQFDAPLARIWGATVADLAETFSYNVLRRPQEPARFQRHAVNVNVSRKAAAEFREIVRGEGQALLERMDAWLTRHESTADEPKVRLGVGIYHIEKHPD
jgi:hypothetical protein